MRVEAGLVLLAVRTHESRELGARRAFTPPQRRECAERGDVHRTMAERLPRLAKLVRHRIERHARLRRRRADQRQRLVATTADRLLERLVGALADLLHLGPVVLLELVERRGVRDVVTDHPLPHPPDRVRLDLEGETLLRFVAFVTAAGGMSLRLRHLDDVHDRGHVFAPHALGDDRVGVAERDVVPALYDLDLESRTAVAPHARERGRH